jgi:hypothetical protein
MAQAPKLRKRQYGNLAKDVKFPTSHSHYPRTFGQVKNHCCNAI